MLPRNKRLKHVARSLRKNQTEAENRLWQYIRRKQIENRQFYRQTVIGNYIVDFYCPACRLVLEIDGSQHYTEEGLEKDKVRDSYLINLGLKVLRISAHDVMINIEGVVEVICMHTINPPYPPLKNGEFLSVVNIVT